MGKELSPEKKRRIAAARRRQEKAWQAKNGPLVSYKIGETHPQTRVAQE